MNAPRWSPLLIAITSLARLPWLARTHRVRGWGRLPFVRGGTALIANHQYENESEIVVERTFLHGPWHKPIHSLGSRRMFEPGFFALRLPFTARFTRNLNVEPLLRGEGFFPIENQLASRPLQSLADAVRARHGDLALATVFADDVLTGLGPAARVLSDLWRPEDFAAAQAPVKLTRVREPYRGETLARTRETLDRDVAEIVAAVRAGATVYVTAEGTYSTDGRMGRLKGIVQHVLPVATPWLAAIAFDPFRGRRLSMLYRVLPPADPLDLDASLAAARPLTTSAAVAAFVHERGSAAFGADEAIAHIRALLAGLPASVFADPELRASPEACAREALATLVVRGALVRTGGAYARGESAHDARFPAAADMLAYQAAFCAETLAAALRLEERSAAKRPEG